MSLGEIEVLGIAFALALIVPIWIAFDVYRGRRPHLIALIWLSLTITFAVGFTSDILPEDRVLLAPIGPLMLGGFLIEALSLHLYFFLSIACGVFVSGIVLIRTMPLGQALLASTLIGPLAVQLAILIQSPLLEKAQLELAGRHNLACVSLRSFREVLQDWGMIGGFEFEAEFGNPHGLGLVDGRVYNWSFRAWDWVPYVLDSTESTPNPNVSVDCSQ